MDIIIHSALGILYEASFLLNKMSLFLLFGFVFAGVLHIFLKEGTIAKHLGSNSVGSVVKASLFGIPLPLCSCGVLPAALSLKKEGASNGAVLSFLISTPMTGVDSILATYALLGGLFATYRVIACFLAGLCAGFVGNLVLADKPPEKINTEEKKINCKLCFEENCSTSQHPIHDKIKGVIVYAFRFLLEDVGVSLIVGLFLGGLISYFAPPTLVAEHLGSGLMAMIIMMLLGVPMYVCATSSIPIVASLMLKGMSPGAAFVFLMAGPATNTVAIAVIGKQLGKKALFVFLGSVVISSLLLGSLLDVLWNLFNVDLVGHVMRHGEHIPVWIEQGASIVLLLAIALNILRKKHSDCCSH